MSSAAAPRRRLVAGAAMGCVLLSAADTYVIVLALPAMMASLGVGLDELQRATPIVSGFLLGYVAVMPLIGRLSDQLGRRPLLLGCLAIFAGGSLITASAGTLGEAVAGRALQGLGGGGLVPVTLALVADLWQPAERVVPLGVAGAVQELGSVVGPLYGALILTLSSWRAIFWLNLPLCAAVTAVLVLAWPRRRRAAVRPLALVLGALAVAAGGLAIAAPPVIVDDATWGNLFVPLLGAGWLTPMAVAALVAAAGALAAAGMPGLARAARRAVTAVDLVGALCLAAALSLVVVAFAGADPGEAALNAVAGPLLAGAAACAVLFVVRQRRAATPLVPGSELRQPPAVGAIAANFFAGAALMAALVDIPVLARATVFPDSQLAAALVLLRLLVAVPVGAVVGGRLVTRLPPAAVAAAGLAAVTAGFCLMARWSATTLADPFGPGWLHPSDPVLVATGLGFGLAIAPVSASLLAAVRPNIHGLASSLLVVARMAGMLMGISVLTAIGLHAFHVTASSLPTPVTLCPASPLHCSRYDTLVTGTVVGELQTVFLGAAACAALAAAVAAVTLRGTRAASPIIASGV